MMKREVQHHTSSWQTTTFDGGPAKEKRQIALASGDYPDLFLLIPWVDQFTQAELLKLGQQGVAVPLNDLIDEYAPNIKKALDANAGVQGDGDRAGRQDLRDAAVGRLLPLHVPGQAVDEHAWLKKLGLEQPKTTEDMRKVLRGVQDQGPERQRQGRRDPAQRRRRGTALIPYLMNAFIYDPQGTSGEQRLRPWSLNDGKVDIQANKDGWREGLKYINSLYKEGLIDKGAFTQNPDALQQQGNNAEDGHPRLGAGAAPGHLRHARLARTAGTSSTTRYRR